MNVVFTTEVLQKHWPTWFKHLSATFSQLVADIHVDKVVKLKDIEPTFEAAVYRVLFTKYHAFKAFSWKNYWQKRNECLQMVGAAELDMIMVNAEELMYAPVFSSDLQFPPVEDFNDDSNEVLPLGDPTEVFAKMSSLFGKVALPSE